MSCKRWYSKTDVLNDLAFATGKKVRDINEDYMVIGEQPPPRHMVDEEMEESMLRLSGGGAPSQEIEKPDLIGITQMIRMVDQFYEKPSNVSHKNVKNNIETNTVVSISKLNPCVAEFVPNNIGTNKNLNKLRRVGVNKEKPNVDENETSKEDNNKGSANVEQLKSPKKSNNIKETNETDSLRNNSSRIDTSRLTPVEMQEMREKLKTKISGTSNASCVKAKRERNLAIATLVKLHCQSPKTVTEDNKPKLIAPDYYQKSLLDHEKVARDNDCVQQPDNIPASGIAQPDISAVKSLTDKKFEPLVDKDTIDRSLMGNKTDHRFETSGGVIDNNIQNENTQTQASLNKENSNNDLTKDVKESIEKVESWLNSPIKKATKVNSVYLGPITFKRKVNSKPMSPISTDSDKTIVKKTENFVPSEFASELTKKYMERNKAIEEAAEQDIWTKLESELKAKDEIIKKQRLQMSISNLDTADFNN